MERLVLEVNDDAAKAWHITSAEVRAQITRNVEITMSDLLSRANDANFESLLNQVRYEVDGLTKEILKALFASDQNTLNLPR